MAHPIGIAAARKPTTCDSVSVVAEPDATQTSTTPAAVPSPPPAATPSARTPGLDAAAIEAHVNQAVRAALAAHLPQVPRQPGGTAGDRTSIEQVLREAWQLDDLDDVSEIATALAPQAARLRDRAASPVERRALRAAREMQTRLAAQDQEIGRIRRERQDAAAQTRARTALGAHQVWNPDHVVACAAAEGRLQIDDETGDLVVVRDGRETGEPLEGFFTAYLRANPQFLKPAATGGPRVAPGAISAGTAPAPRIDVTTREGRKAVWQELLQNPTMLEPTAGEAH